MNNWEKIDRMLVRGCLSGLSKDQVYRLRRLLSKEPRPIPAKPIPRPELGKEFVASILVEVRKAVVRHMGMAVNEIGDGRKGLVVRRRTLVVAALTNLDARLLSEASALVSRSRSNGYHCMKLHGEFMSIPWYAEKYQLVHSHLLDHVQKQETRV